MSDNAVEKIGTQLVKYVAKIARAVVKEELKRLDKTKVNKPDAKRKREEATEPKEQPEEKKEKQEPFACDGLIHTGDPCPEETPLQHKSKTIWENKKYAQCKACKKKTLAYKTEQKKKKEHQ